MIRTEVAEKARLQAYCPGHPFVLMRVRRLGWFMSQLTLLIIKIYSHDIACQML